MHTKFFSRWLRLSVIMLLLLATFAASPVQADVSVTGGIISLGPNHTCALRPDGSIDCWGAYGHSLNSSLPGPYTQVSTSREHSCALTPVGAVDCWGDNGAGQSTDQPGPHTQVSVGDVHTCALTISGAVDCWGANHYGQAEDQPGLYTEVSAGNRHTCALTISGAVDCWGDNSYSQADDQSGPYTQVSAGYYHTCALRPDSSVDCWGYNAGGQAGDQPGPYTQISAGNILTCALRPDSSADCWGQDLYGEGIDQPGPYTHIETGGYHTCALTPSGAVDCWGNNYYGQDEDQPGPYGPYNPGGDTTPPVVTVTGVTEGSTYILGAVPQAGCSTTDEGSGVAVEASLTLSGGGALGVGSFSATCSGALDNAGNLGNTAVINYSVAFQFTGFSAPVDNLPVMNIAKAGQIIPLKWRLTDANGSPVLTLADVSVTATNLSCDAAMNGDTLEEYVASNSGLQNLGDGYYQWNWKTPTNYANSCKTLHLDLGEGAGSEHTALFQFK